MDSLIYFYLLEMNPMIKDGKLTKHDQLVLFTKYKEFCKSSCVIAKEKGHNSQVESYYSYTKNMYLFHVSILKNM